MKKLKNISRVLHEWLGLTSGIVVFIVSLSGTLFVFCDDVIDIAAGNAKYVSANSSSTKQSISSHLDVFHKKYPEREAFYFDDYKSPNRSFRIASHENGKDFSFTYVNPYSNEIIKTSRSYWVFFFIAAKIHSQLLLHSTGQTIVGISTIIFLVELISGLILWFPKRWNPKSRKASFTIKKNTKWKRKVYDLHKVLGFYVLLPALLITTTGLLMAFKVLNSVAQEVFGGNPHGHELTTKYYPKFEDGKEMQPLDTIVQKLYKENKSAAQIRLGFPYSKKPTAYLQGIVAEKIGLKTWKNGQKIYLNRYTAKTIDLPKDLRMYQHVEQTIFDLHCGFWLGPVGKIITFISGLICTSLPITGFLFWLGRKRRRKKRTVHHL